MEIQIRRARRTDYPTLAALAGWPGVDGDPRRPIRLFRKVIADLGCDPCVAVEGTEPIGFVSVHYSRVLSLGGTLASVEDLVASAEGVSAALLEHACRRAARRGARRLQVNPMVVGEELLRAAKFEPEGDLWTRRPAHLAGNQE